MSSGAVRRFFGFLRCVASRRVSIACLFLLSAAVVAVVFLSHPFRRPSRPPVIAPAVRGTIRDARGVPLAQAGTRPSVWMDLRFARHCRDSCFRDFEELAAVLEKELGLRPGYVLGAPDRPGEFLYLRRWLEPEEAIRLRRLLDDPRRGFARGAVRFRAEAATVFPRGELLAPMLGFTNLDGEGASGLQRRHDRELRGEWRRDPAASSGISRRGSDLYLTIDAGVQEACENFLRKEAVRLGAREIQGVLLRAADARVAAMVSLPSFDPARFRHARHETMRLRPVTDLFQYGPLLRPFLVAAGVEEQGAAFLERGSPDPADLAGRLGVEGMLRAIVRFRLDVRTGIDFDGEPLPLVLRRGTEGEVMPELAYGYGVAAPLHRLAVSGCALVNGGILHAPVLVERVVRPDGRTVLPPAAPPVRVLRPETSRAIRSLMAAAGNDAGGPGRRPAPGGAWASYRPKGPPFHPRPRYLAALLFLPPDRPEWVAAVKAELPAETRPAGREEARRLGAGMMAAAMESLKQGKEGTR